ncbi:hypothetical protein VMCG_09240 [Cytospora schulzeri]|uniref:C2H2-type domain-containing protein n=1 Tax=Cytospora schulzeri TaxID=448051 RepID=A0A423VL13_9PEZI|nr:hypothetical protein VMCG_09240 [Valsa malicola]
MVSQWSLQELLDLEQHRDLNSGVQPLKPNDSSPSGSKPHNPSPSGSSVSNSTNTPQLSEPNNYSRSGSSLSNLSNTTQPSDYSGYSYGYSNLINTPEYYETSVHLSEHSTYPGVKDLIDPAEILNAPGPPYPRSLWDNGSGSKTSIGPEWFYDDQFHLSDLVDFFSLELNTNGYSGVNTPPNESDFLLCGGAGAPKPIAELEERPIGNTDILTGPSTPTCCLHPGRCNAGLGDPNPDTRWHTTKTTGTSIASKGLGVTPGYDAPAKNAFRYRSRSEPPPERHVSSKEHFSRCSNMSAPKGVGLDSIQREARPSPFAFEDSSNPPVTGERQLQSTRTITPHPNEFDSGFFGSPVRCDGTLGMFTESLSRATAQVCGRLHPQAGQPSRSPPSSFQPSAYTRTHGRASEGGEPIHPSLESWDSYTDIDSSERRFSTSTSPWRVDRTTQDPSVATESPASSDTAMTDDTVQWISDYRFTMDSSHPFLSVEVHAVREVVKRFLQWNLGGGSATASGSSSQSTPASSQTQKEEKGKNPQKRPARDDDELGEDGKDEPPPKKRSRKKVSHGQPRLACHFQKRFPEQHPMCGGWLLISHVKQHLRLKHTRSPYYCPRCNTEFKTEEERDEHIELIISSPCQKRTYDTSTEISARVAKQLQKRVESASGLHEQWSSVWDTIFPDVVRPATCTYDICSELPVQVLGLYSYLETEGPGTVISVLQRHGLGIGVENLQQILPDQQTYIRRVLFQACREICQNWQAQREQASSSTSSLSSSSPANQPISPSTPTHMNNDSNITGELTQASVEPNSRSGMNSATYTPNSISNEGDTAMNLPVETSSRQNNRRVSEPGAQSQPSYITPHSPVPILDLNSNEDRFSWHASTATDGGVVLDGSTPQDRTLSTLQYPVEDSHLADTIFDFDLPMLQNFNPGTEEVIL